MRTRQGLALDGRAARLCDRERNVRCRAPRGARSAVRCVTWTVGVFGELAHRAPADGALPAAARRQPVLMAITTKKRKCNRDVPRSTEGLYAFPRLRTLR